MYKNHLIAVKYEQFADKRAYVQISINNSQTNELVRRET